MADAQQPNTAEAVGGPGASQPAVDGGASSNPRDHRSAAILSAARDMARHAYNICEQECGGDIVRLTELLFEQARVAAATNALLIEMGCTVLARRVKMKARPR